MTDVALVQEWVTGHPQSIYEGMTGSQSILPLDLVRENSNNIENSNQTSISIKAIIDHMQFIQAVKYACNNMISLLLTLITPNC